MSKLDSLLSELKASLDANKKQESPPTATVAADEHTIDKAQARAALQQFINAALLAKPAANGPADSKSGSSFVPEWRQALSAFVGSPLGNGPVSATSAPSAARPTPSPAPAPVQAPAAVQPTTPAPTNSPTAAPATQATATATTTKPSPAFAWQKHIMTVESALQMRDFHFADSVLSVLMDIAEALEPDLSTRGRLVSQRARVRLERKQLAEAEAELTQILKTMEGTSHKRGAGAAYCLLALAHTYSYQSKPEKAEAARRMSVSIAEESFGSKDPQMMLFKQDLPK